ncbi:MAG: rubredoxin [Spirochaetia bacterium]|nr:rubredoxin [Spirochaetia bacterium]
MIRIPVRGGMTSVSDLRKIVEWCLTNGVRQIMPGMRQEILLIDANLKQTPSLHGLGFETIPDGFYNIMSSIVSTGIESSVPWMSNAVYRRILEDLPTFSSLRIQIQDPVQKLLTGLSSDLLFSAAGDVDTWNIYVHDSATKRLRIIDAICTTMQVSTIATMFEKHRTSFAEAGPFLQEVFGIKKTRSSHQFRPLSAPMFEGVHAYHEGYWLGITSRDGIFSPDHIQRVISLARTAGTGYVFFTPYHSLLLKNLPEPAVGMASTLPLRHSEQELFWQSAPDAISLRQRVSRALVREQLPLKVATAALTSGDPVEAPLRLVRARRLPLRLNLEITEQTEGGYEFHVKQSGSLRSILPAIAFAEGGKPGPQVVSPPESTLACPDCGTAYMPEYGDPMAEIVPGTACDELPGDYCCSVCGYLFNPESVSSNRTQSA